MSYILPFLIFFSSFSVYLFSSIPSIYWKDSSEFQTVAYLLDIAHPAGSPLYSLVVKTFTFIPVGSIAFKTTLASCFFGAAISVLLYFILLSTLQQLTKGNSSASCLFHWVAFVTALLFSFSDVLWENSNITEVYTLQNFFTALILLLLLQVKRHGVVSINSRLRVSLLFGGLAFIYGLSLGSHAILVLYLPFLILWVYFVWMRPASLNISKTYAVLLFFFLLGFSVYLYLPIRSAQNPYYDWGNPETFHNLMVHASDRKDASVHFDMPTQMLPKEIFHHMKYYPENFSFLGIIGGIIGLCYLVLKREKYLLGIYVMLSLPPFLFFIRYWGGSSAFIPTFLVFDIFLGVGLWVCFSFIQTRLEQNRLKTVYVTCFWVLFGVQFILLFSSNLAKNNNAAYWAPRDIMKKVFHDLPSNAVVFSLHTWFGFNYLQQTEGDRPDITVLGINGFIKPEFFTNLESDRFPNVVVPDVPIEDLGSAFLTENIWSHPTYWEPGANNRLVERYLMPDGFLFKVDPDATTLNDNLVRSYLSNLSQQVNFGGISNNGRERAFYGQIVAGQGLFFLERGSYNIALHHFKLSSALAPTETFHLNAMGIAYARLKDYERAENAFLESLSMNPNNYITYFNLAEMHYYSEKYEEAEKYYKKVLYLQPTHTRALYHLGKLGIKNVKKEEAIVYFKKVLKVRPNHEDALRQLELLQSS